MVNSKNYQIRVLFLLIIISIIIVNAGCSLFRPIRKEHFLAYSHLWERETEKARKYIDAAHDNYVKKFLLVSLELSEGNLEKAGYYAEQFIADHKDIPDGKVLLNLVQRRKSFPDERWVYSYAEAWRKAGSPRLKVIEEFLKDYDWNIEEDDCKDYRKDIPVCTFDYLLTSYGNSGCDNRKDFEDFLGQIKPDLPLEIKLLILYFLDSDVFLPDSFVISDELKEEIKRKRREIIHRLAVEFPSYMGFEIIDILERSPEAETLSIKEIEMLEKAVARKRLSVPMDEIYSLYLKRYQYLGNKTPYHDAYIAAGMADHLLIFSNLTSKIDASAETATPEMKKRLSNILEKVGKAYLKRKGITNVLVGISTLYNAYRIRGDKEAEKSLTEAYSAFKENIFNVHSFFAGSVEFLPIAPLIVDAIEFKVRDEIGFYLLLTGEEMPKVLSELINEPLSN
jgi:hypothetical protein